MAEKGLLSIQPCAQQLRTDFLHMSVRTAQAPCLVSSHVACELQSHGDSALAISVRLGVSHAWVQTLILALFSCMLWSKLLGPSKL